MIRVKGDGYRMDQSATKDEKIPATPLEADDMDAFLDCYFVDPLVASSSSSSEHHQRHDDEQQRRYREAAAKKADEDLEVLLKETDDMRDIQEQIHLEQVEMADKYREEKSKQRRAAAARSRYQRMSENERRVYNSRRRLRQLGLDPEAVVNQGAPVRDHLKQANAKKAEAARLRYHRMTPGQKRDYNRRRTEAFRRRRQEEETLLSTPAGRISTEALAKAQQIMIRNARKAESARLRYQKMTPEERKFYNMKRAMAKKSKRMMRNGMMEEEGEDEEMQHMDDHIRESIDEEELMQEMEPVEQQSIYSDPLIDVCSESSEDHILHVINEVAHPNELEIFTQMEKEVIRRTQIANATIQKQYADNSPNLDSLAQALAGTASSNAIVGGIQYDVAPVDVLHVPSLVKTENSREAVCMPENGQEKAHVIDEKMLHEMVRTGMDLNGLPVEIRTVEGKRIRSVGDMMAISHGQTVLITQQHYEAKPFTCDPSSSSADYSNPEPTTSASISQYPQEVNGEEEVDDEEEEEEEGEEGEYEDNNGTINPGDMKVKVTRARRAERARARYHRMSVDQRKEQNAKRALMLRKMRARDEHLCQLGETVPVEQLDKETLEAIRDAQQRRMKRAEQARTKYHRMNAEQRRRYNASRDAQRKIRKEALSGKQEDATNVQMSNTVYYTNLNSSDM